jgi:hypothetical protein
MPQDVIDCMHTLAWGYSRGLEVGDHNGNTTVNDFDDANNNDDESYHPMMTWMMD